MHFILKLQKSLYPAFKLKPFGLYIVLSFLCDPSLSTLYIAFLQIRVLHFQSRPFHTCLLRPSKPDRDWRRRWPDNVKDLQTVN